MVIWLVGLSGAGKTTVGECLFDHFKPELPNLVLLDGDGLREVWGNDLGHTVEGRRNNARRVSHLTRMLDKQNIHVIAAVNVMFPEWRAWNRKNFSALYEVFLDAPIDLLLERDSKGLYSAIETGKITNVVGIDIHYPRPTDVDLHLHGEQMANPPGTIADMIIDAVPAMSVCQS
jgi:adenylylsulfate kinase-like enzyme